MRKTGKFALSCAIAAFAVAGGCQTTSRFAFFGTEEKTPQPPQTRTVSHTETADERLLESFYTSVEASRLEGQSISHLPPGRDTREKRTAGRLGPGRQRPDGPGMPQY
jgi:hypothetical protein